MSGWMLLCQRGSESTYVSTGNAQASTVFPPNISRDFPIAFLFTEKERKRIHVHVWRPEVNLQGVYSLFLPRGTWGLNSGCQAWEQVSSLVEPSHWPSLGVLEQRKESNYSNLGGGREREEEEAALSDPAALTLSVPPSSNSTFTYQQHCFFSEKLSGSSQAEMHPTPLTT